MSAQGFIKRQEERREKERKDSVKRKLRERDARHIKACLDDYYSVSPAYYHYINVDTGNA
jgi:hypothetical protein